MNLPSSRGRGRRAPMADINVTPLVDVMLVLLIIFMVTAPLMTAGVPVNLPDARAKALEQEQKPVELSPQNAYIRRLQHQMAERANLVSRSRGREPFRRVRLYPDAARSTWR